MDAGIATVVAAVIGALASLGVAWMTTRERAASSTRSRREAVPAFDEDTTHQQPSLNKDSSIKPRPNTQTTIRPPETTSRRHSIAIYALYAVTGFCLFGTASGIVFAIVPPAHHVKGDYSLFLFYVIPTLIFLPITIYVRKSARRLP